ncbi:MAG: four helix bundle protein [Bacteroidia bacterium]|nr:four helix bundle protein [Bacteroidia bacterium]
MGSTLSYKDLIVWQETIILVNVVYIIAKKFPREEIFGLLDSLKIS